MSREKLSLRFLSNSTKVFLAKPNILMNGSSIKYRGFVKHYRAQPIEDEVGEALLVGRSESPLLNLNTLKTCRGV